MNRIPNRFRRVAKIAIITSILGSIAWALVAQGERYLAEILKTSWLTIAVGLGACCLYRLCNAHGWWFVLRALGQPLPAFIALKLWLTSEACRWLPGSVWNFGSRALLGARAGVAPASAAASLVLELALTIAAWFMIAAICFPNIGRELLARVASSVPAADPSFRWAVPLGVLALAGVASWFVLRQRMRPMLTRVKNLIASLSGARPHPLRCCAAGGYFTLMALLNGAGLFCVLRLMNHTAEVPFSVVVGANAAAWLIGFFAVFAPGGLVVREGSLAAGLAPWMPLEQAVAVAFVWRMLQIGAELICGLAVFIPSAIGSLRFEPGTLESS